ncbi:MAG: hypothetical protein IT260_08180 [Saprospiraceae bacterium]|nr:hypothetical protein [Saprospiraceae bacterium]
MKPFWCFWAIVLYLTMGSAPAAAQCYGTYRDAGKNLLTQGLFDEAIQKFERAKKCQTDKPPTGDQEIGRLIQDARQRKKEAEQRRQTELENQREQKRQLAAQQQNNSDIEWERIRKNPSAADCADYLRQYPEGRYAKEARQCVFDYTDSDMDGVRNGIDNCPETYGSGLNGCPMTEKAIPALTAPQEVASPTDVAAANLLLLEKVLVWDAQTAISQLEMPKARPIGFKFADNKIKEEVRSGNPAKFEKRLKRAKSTEDKQENTFYLGYIHFITKRFTLAKSYFTQLAELPGDPYYFASNYYLAYCHSFENEQEACIKRLGVASKYKDYDGNCRLLLAITLFNGKKYNDVKALLQGLSQSSWNYKAELNYLLARVYVQERNETEALLCLESIQKDIGIFGVRDAYFLAGYLQKRAKNYPEAILSLSEIYTDQTATGQLAALALGECYLKQGEKFLARKAFGIAKENKSDASITEKALFCFGVLSLDLLFVEEGRLALNSIRPSSKYFGDAQRILAQKH